MRRGGGPRFVTDAPAGASAVIVGGGIAGLSIAREFAERGLRDVVVVEQAYPGSGATGRNVARIRAMQLTRMLTEVGLRCQAKYERMGTELDFNVLFYRLGYAWLLYADDEVARMRDIVEMHHELGVPSRLLDDAETLQLLPVLRGGEPVRGAVHNDDAIVHHDAVVWALLDHLGRLGVSVLVETRVEGVERGDSVKAVHTNRGRIATDVVVNAAGGWSRELNALASVRAPNQPFRREVLVTAPIERAIDAAVTFYRPMEGWFNQTLRGEIVMGVVDPDEAAALDQRSSWDFLRRTARVITAKAPVLAGVSVIRQWGGVYDVTPDHLPLVGPTNQLAGWWQANGWSGRGMLLAPYLGELLVERLLEGVSPPLLGPFLPDRFEAGAAATAGGDYYGRYEGEHAAAGAPPPSGIRPG